MLTLYLSLVELDDQRKVEEIYILSPADVLCFMLPVAFFKMNHWQRMLFIKPFYAL